MIYRIYTEDKDNLTDILDRYLKCYTVLSGMGCFNGKHEKCVVVEVSSEGNDYNLAARIKATVSDIKSEMNQETVLVQCLAVYKSELL